MAIRSTSGLAAALSSNLFLFKSVPYDPIRDFTPVAMVSESGPFVISVQSELPFKGLPDLVSYAKANPGKLSYGIDASSGYQVVIGQLLTKRAGIDMVQVPYPFDGASDAGHRGRNGPVDDQRGRGGGGICTVGQGTPDRHHIRPAFSRLGGFTDRRRNVARLSR